MMLPSPQQQQEMSTAVKAFMEAAKNDQAQEASQQLAIMERVLSEYKEQSQSSTVENFADAFLIKADNTENNAEKLYPPLYILAFSYEMHQNPDVMRLMLKYGAKPSVQYDGYSPYYHLLRTSDHGLNTVFSEYPPSIHELCSMIESASPMMSEYNRRHLETALRSCPALLLEEDEMGMNPLLRGAVAHKNKEAVRIIAFHMCLNRKYDGSSMDWLKKQVNLIRNQYTVVDAANVDQFMKETMNTRVYFDHLMIYLKHVNGAENKSKLIADVKNSILWGIFKKEMREEINKIDLSDKVPEIEKVQSAQTDKELQVVDLKEINHRNIDEFLDKHPSFLLMKDAEGHHPLLVQIFNNRIDDDAINIWLTFLLRTAAEDSASLESEKRYFSERDIVFSQRVFKSSWLCDAFMQRVVVIKEDAQKLAFLRRALDVSMLKSQLGEDEIRRIQVDIKAYQPKPPANMNSAKTVKTGKTKLTGDALRLAEANISPLESARFAWKCMRLVTGFWLSVAVIMAACAATHVTGLSGVIGLSIGAGFTSLIGIMMGYVAKHSHHEYMSELQKAADLDIHPIHVPLKEMTLKYTESSSPTSVSSTPNNTADVQPGLARMVV